MATPEKQGAVDRLIERFPALGRLSASSFRELPFVGQLTRSDCGLACLAMVLQFHRRHEELEDIRRVLPAGMGGVRADLLLEAAAHFGLRGRAVSVEVEDLEYLQRASILHWDFSHFVVLDRVKKNGVIVADPAL